MVKRIPLFLFPFPFSLMKNKIPLNKIQKNAPRSRVASRKEKTGKETLLPNRATEVYLRGKSWKKRTV